MVEYLVTLRDEGFDVNKATERDGNTPLHVAVEWFNKLPAQGEEYGTSVIQVMLHHGSDPR